ncbi:MAG: FUSC family protein [Pseudomonadota bacterium]
MSDYDRARLLTPLACWITYICAIALSLDAPWWATASAWMIGNADYTKLYRKGLFRATGTVIGCVIGYVTAIVCGTAMLPMLVVLWVVGAITLYKRYTSAYGYAWLLAGATVAIVLFEAMMGNDDLRRLTLARGIELSLGVIVSALLNAAFRPKI